MSSILDVRYTQLREAGDLDDDTPIRLLHGTAERLGRIHVAEPRENIPAGATVWAQLRLDAPLPCWPGDRFVIRRPSPQQTLGGGVIVDAWAPRLRARDRDRWPAQLQRLQAGERVVWLERAGEDGLEPAAWAERGGTGGVHLGERIYAPTVVSRLEGALLDALSAYHAEHPLSLGPNRRELRRDRLAHLPEKTFDGLVDRLATAKTVEIEGPVLRVHGFSVALSADQAALRDRVRKSFEAAAFAGLLPKALHDKHPEREVAQIVKLLDDAGHIVAVPDLGWVAAEAIEDMESRVRGWFASHDELTPGDFKELTGLSRKAAIPWLEWLDKSRLTRRVGDARARGPRP
jgi:selenocysteine-specific elongation factor